MRCCATPSSPTLPRLHSHPRAQQVRRAPPGKVVFDVVSEEYYRCEGGLPLPPAPPACPRKIVATLPHDCS